MRVEEEKILGEDFANGKFKQPNLHMRFGQVDGNWGT
jgi:hypothetical protein